MQLSKTLFIRRIMIFTVSLMLSVSTMATEFDQTQRLASQGDASAQYKLGLMYIYGEGVDSDSTKAIEWFKKAGNQGHAEALYEIGSRYHYGLSVDKDFTKAVEWYEKAGNQGHAESQYKVAKLRIFIKKAKVWIKI